MYIFLSSSTEFQWGEEDTRKGNYGARYDLCVVRTVRNRRKTKKTKMINNPDLFTSGNEMFQSKFRKTG